MSDNGQRPTLEQVAALAGTSRATASRVINRSTKVRPDLRAAVERAVEELGYAPNWAARSLVTRRSDAIGLVVSEREERLFGEPFFATLVRGVADALAATDMQFVLLLSRSDEERARVERYVATHVDGVLLVSAHSDEPLIDRLGESGMPAVLAGRPLRATSLPYVDVDNVTGARCAVEHLLSRGRTRIATIAGPQDMAAGIDRLQGYRHALAAAGAGSEEMVATGDFSAASGERALDELLDRYPRIDAVFAASDLMATGAVQALERRGRVVPDDVAIVGFDDSVVASTTRPALTSVHQPVGELGQHLVDRLRGTLFGTSRVPSATILPTHLVVRNSS